jgi:hypothetical protein
VTWTTPADLKAQVQRLWDRGLLLQCLLGDDHLFPRRLTLKVPSSTDLTNRFDAVRAWITELQQGVGLRIVMRDVNHRVIGNNAVPREVWIDSLQDALQLIGKGRDARRFANLVDITRDRFPQLLSLLERRPLEICELAKKWPFLLDVVAWMQQNPRPGIYLRQIDVPGVHTKYIEAHLGILSEMLDLVLPAAAIDALATGAGQFCARYGLRDKPLRIRFRILDPNLALLPCGVDQDLTLDQHSFSTLAVNVDRVFMTENEINFLSFPALAGAMVVFGAGYGFEKFGIANWLGRCDVMYWGDIDTHGFAILDQLRGLLPRARSFLMDRETLLAHRGHWGTEPKAERRDLRRLTAEEQALFDDLRDNKLGDSVRLEQERIGFGWLQASLREFA